MKIQLKSSLKIIMDNNKDSKLHSSGNTLIYTWFDFIPEIAVNTFEKHKIIITRAGLLYICTAFCYILYAYFNIGWRSLKQYEKEFSKKTLKMIDFNP